MAKAFRETREGKKKRARTIVRLLRAKYPKATTLLHYKTPHELLVATVLAAQATDKKINEITVDLFKKYRRPADFARARQAVLEKEIKQAGFFRNKARALIALSRDIVDRFGGEVPDNLDDLTSLRGVGRKTANVVLAAVFGKPSIVVDTHMIRVANRLALTSNKDPVKIEFDLMDVVDKRSWSNFSFTMTLHGRQVCKAPRPICQICVVERWCPSSTLGHGPVGHEH
jgi:endonuclease-3